MRHETTLSIALKITATFALLYGCYRTLQSMNNNPPPLFSMPKIRIAHNDLVERFGCLANVPREIIDEYNQQGYYVIEIDRTVDGHTSKLIIVYQEF